MQRAETLTFFGEVMLEHGSLGGRHSSHGHEGPQLEHVRVVLVAEPRFAWPGADGSAIRAHAANVAVPESGEGDVGAAVDVPG